MRERVILTILATLYVERTPRTALDSETEKDSFSRDSVLALSAGRQRIFWRRASSRIVRRGVNACPRGLIRSQHALPEPLDKSTLTVKTGLFSRHSDRLGKEPCHSSTALLILSRVPFSRGEDG